MKPVAGGRPPEEESGFKLLRRLNTRNLPDKVKEDAKVHITRVNKLVDDETTDGGSVDDDLAEQQNTVEPELMGKVYRHPITSRILLTESGSKFDFDFVDMSTRAEIDLTRQQVVNDKYLFKPVVLKYRTWIWHDIYRGLFDEGLVSRTPGQGLWHAINLTCFDEFSDAGMWSPTMIFAPAAALVVLSMDPVMCYVALVIFGLLLVSDRATNNAGWYHLNRLLTLPTRLVYMGVIGWRIAVNDIGIASQLACVLLMLCSLADIVLGDLTQLFSVRMRTTYTVLRVLPEQIAVCIKHKGTREPLDYTMDRDLTGFAGIDDIVILANAMGVLVELVPLSQPDIQAFQKAEKSGKKLKFVGLDVFDSLHPNINALDPDGLTIYPKDFNTTKKDWEDPINFSLRNFMAHQLGMPWTTWLAQEEAGTIPEEAPPPKPTLSQSMASFVKKVGMPGLASKLAGEEPDKEGTEGATKEGEQVAMKKAFVEETQKPAAK